MGEANTQPRALRPAEFCERYSVGQTTFFRLQKEGALKTRKVGRATVIAVEDAEAWFASLEPATS